MGGSDEGVSYSYLVSRAGQKNTFLEKFSSTLLLCPYDTLSSGHYTSKLFYADAAYNCDDHNISKFNNSIVLNSKLAYVVFYAKNR